MSIYYVIPAEVFEDKRLEHSEIIFYALLSGLAKSGGYCYASDKYLAQRMHCGVSTVQTWLRKFEKLGYVLRETTKDGMKWERKIFITHSIKGTKDNSNNVCESSSMRTSNARARGLEMLAHEDIVSEDIASEIFPVSNHPCNSYPCSSFPLPPFLADRENMDNKDIQKDKDKKIPKHLEKLKISKQMKVDLAVFAKEIFDEALKRVKDEFRGKGKPRDQFAYLYKTCLNLSKLRNMPPNWAVKYSLKE